jgi:MFS family permease
MSENSRSIRKIKCPGLPGTVIALGLVSFLTDLSSEMIYPLLPGFLVSVLGAGAVSLGIIEGVAESTASLLKVVSGFWSDRVRRRKPLILAGYTLSGAARPLIGLAAAWPFVLIMRFLDRIGKGLRTSPRDSLIADVTDPAVRGRAYGLHRAMDHAGAVAGPLVAAALMSFAGVSMRYVFLLAGIPSILVVIVLVKGVRESPPSVHEPDRSTPGGGWRDLGTDYRRLLLAVLVFSLGNSTDAFLLLRLTEAGVGASFIAILWSVHHIVKMFATYQGGRLSDMTGNRAMIIAGWIFYATIYLAFALVQSRDALIAVFIAYGIYFGLTEPAEKSWVVNLVPASLRGTAFGYYHGAVGFAALPASLIFGIVWQSFGVRTAFSLGAALAVIASALVYTIPCPGPGAGEGT